MFKYDLGENLNKYWNIIILCAVWRQRSAAAIVQSLMNQSLNVSQLGRENRWISVMVWNFPQEQNKSVNQLRDSIDIQNL